jgi:hypothetical protein
MSVGTVKKEQGGQRDVFGGKQFSVIDYAGPTSYANSGVGATSGDQITPSMFGFFNTILCPIISDGFDQSGTYEMIWQPVQSGLTPWRVRWFVVATGVEVANGVNLSAYVVKMAALGY